MAGNETAGQSRYNGYVRFWALTEDERRANFEHFLDRAIRFGDAKMVSLGILTWDAIAVVADQYPNPSVEAV